LGKTIIKDTHASAVQGIFEPMEDTSLPEMPTSSGRYELLLRQIPGMFDIGGNFVSPDVV
jgi:hypothetical protein